jgi:hypothetical protein
MNGDLTGYNIEAARAELRGLSGEIPVFQEGRHLVAGLTINAASLLRNPDTHLKDSSNSPGDEERSDGVGAVRSSD